MSNKIVPQTYRHIIDDVIQNIRGEFEEFGIAESVLGDLQSRWEAKVMASHVADFETITQAVPAAVPVPGVATAGGVQVKPEPSDGYNIPMQRMPYLPGPQLGRHPPPPHQHHPYLQMPHAQAHSLPMQQSVLVLPRGAPPGLPRQQQAYEQRIPQVDGPARMPQLDGPAASPSSSGSGATPPRTTHPSLPPPPSHAQHPPHPHAQNPSHPHAPHPSLPRPPPAAAPANGAPQPTVGRSAPETSEINSDLDDSDSEEEDGIDAEGAVQDIVFCTYDKVARVKNKWKCVLKDGMIHVNGRDYLFSRCTGEFEW